MKEIKFNRMCDKDFWSRPQLGDAGYTFRNGGGEGDFVFTLLESFDADDCKWKKIKVICHNMKIMTPEKKSGMIVNIFRVLSKMENIIHIGTIALGLQIITTKLLE